MDTPKAKSKGWTVSPFENRKLTTFAWSKLDFIRSFDLLKWHLPFRKLVVKSLEIPKSPGKNKPYLKFDKKSFIAWWDFQQTWCKYFRPKTTDEKLYEFNQIVP